MIIDPAGNERLRFRSSELGSETELVPDSYPEPEAPVVQAFALFDNVYVLARKTDSHQAEEHDEISRKLKFDRVDQFDLPEADRMYALAVQFVADHVRRVRSARSVTRKRQLEQGALVVSEKKVPRFPFRFARVRWTIEHSSVIDLRGHRVFRPRLSNIEIPQRSFIWAPGPGDSFDLAYILGNVCAILHLHIPEPLAVVGDVGGATDDVIGGHYEIEQKRGTAREQGIRHLIIPARSGFMPGDHLGVRYWPVNDVNGAVFCMLAAACRQ
ncbi:MAG: hypothetical protein WAM97_17870 [Acidimicrobiales bacterium]